MNTTISSYLNSSFVTKKLKINFEIMLCILRMAQKIGLAVTRTRRQIKLCVTIWWTSTQGEMLCLHIERVF